MDAADQANREKALFEQALEAGSAAERLAFLKGACGEDAVLLARVQALLQANETAEGFLPEPPAGQTLLVPVTEKPGDRIGRYKLREKIGEGGCGVVYVAEQEEPVRRKVALKVIKLGMDTRNVIARFQAERQALAMMDHPNIAKVLDAGATETGRPYFVMELVRGVRITDYCDQNHLATRARLDLFMQICRAVQHAHQKGIIHRDLKPSNILVTLHDGVPVPKVIDFGIAKATEGRLSDLTVYTELNQFIGTPAYMSPEQAEMSGLDIDTRSDIYSLGVLLYELLTGKTPFAADELMRLGLDEMRRTIREKEPVRPSTRLSTMLEGELTTTAKHRASEPPRLIHLVCGDLDWIVMKCLEKDRTRRYETANGLAADLKRHLDNEPVVARPPSAAYRLQKSLRRNKLVFTAATAAAAALVFGMSVSVWQAVRATRAEREQAHLREVAEKARAGEATQRKQAEAAQAKENQLRKLAQFQAYAADMKAAQAALQQSSRQQAVTLLHRYWPKPGEPDLRGLEWRHLWQAAKGDEIYTWKHPGMVGGAHFSPDGKQVATACFDGMLRVWNVASGKLVAQFDRGVSEDVLLSFCFAPDGATLATASRDGIALLDCATWQVKQTLELPDAERVDLGIMSLTYSPDGRWLAAAVYFQRIRLWNMESRESFTLPAATGGRISFSPSSKTLSVCPSGQVIELWDLATRQKADEFGRTDKAWFLTGFSPQGDRLVAAGGTGCVALWDIRSGKELWSQQAHHSRVYALAFSHDGQHFASGGFDQVIHIWDAATQKEVMTLKGHLNEIWSLEFSPDDRHLLTSSKDGTAMLWDAQTHPRPDYWMLDNDETPVGFTPDGRGLLSISGDGTTLRRRNGPQVIKSLTCAMQFGNEKTTFSPETQSLYALSPDGEVRIYDVNNLHVKRSFRISEPCSRLYHVSPDGRWLTGCGTNVEDLHVWSTSGESVAHIKEFGGGSSSYDLAVFSPNSQLLAVAEAKGEVKLWDVTKREFIRTLGAHPWRLYAISFSPDGRQLASSSWAGDIRIFDVATGKETLPPLHGHGSGVHGVSFSSDGATLVSGGDDSSVRFWNVATGREMLRFENAYNLVARLPFLSPTGELLVYRDFTQNLRGRVTAIPTLAEIEKTREAESSVP